MKSINLASTICVLLVAAAHFTNGAEETEKEVKLSVDEGNSADASAGKNAEKLETADSFNVGYYGHHGAPGHYANHYSYAKYIVPAAVPAYSVSYGYGYPAYGGHYASGHHGAHHGYSHGHVSYVAPAYVQPVYTAAAHYPHHHHGLSSSYNYGISAHGKLAAHALSYGVPLYNSHRYQRFGVYH